MKIFRFLVVLVVVCGLIGISASVAGAIYKLEGGGFQLQAARACNISGAWTDDAYRLGLISAERNKVADQATAVQNLSEMVALLIIVPCYLLVVPVCVLTLHRAKVFLIGARRWKQSKTRQALGSDAQGLEMIDRTLHAAQAQQRRLTVLCALIFFTLVPRAAYSVVQAVGNAETVYNRSCRSGWVALRVYQGFSASTQSLLQHMRHLPVRQPPNQLCSSILTSAACNHRHD